MAFSWKLYGDGKTPPLGEAVAPDERLSWPRTIGIGAQHVVAMFGATFVFPLVMGLDPNLAIMMSGIATIIFLLIVKGKVPSYLGTSASFVGGVVAIRAAGRRQRPTSSARSWSPASCWRWSACSSTSPASRLLHAVLPPAVTGAVVMLIGFNLAPVVAGIYWPQDQWVALATMTFVIVCLAAARLLVPHRHPPRPGLRLRALVAARRHGRPDHLGARAGAAEVDDPRPAQPRRCRRGRLVRAARPSPPRLLAELHRCSCCPPSSRWSRRTPGMSRPSRR